MAGGLRSEIWNEDWETRDELSPQIVLKWAAGHEDDFSMSKEISAEWRIVSFAEAEVERLPGKTHFWHCKPGMVADTNLMFVRAQLPPGEAHQFHFHPKMEEILYILSGTAEQWIEKEMRIMKAGDAIYLPVGMVHGTYNIGAETLDFLAVLSPAKSEGPVTVEVSEQEPWRSLR
jgi:quercetin dioxygenase-like cupin family protein